MAADTRLYVDPLLKPRSQARDGFDASCEAVRLVRESSVVISLIVCIVHGVLDHCNHHHNENNSILLLVVVLVLPTFVFCVSTVRARFQLDQYGCFGAIVYCVIATVFSALLPD